MIRHEEGAVLLVVLVALALLAAMAGVALRLGQAGLHALAAEQVVAGREVLVPSALAVLGLRLGEGSDLPRDGSPVLLDLPGGRIGARVQAAEGLVGWQYWPAPEGVSLASPANVAAADLPGLNPLAGQSVDQLAAWAAHPLFAPDRLPPAAAAPVPAEVAPVLEVVAPAPEPDPQPVLQGVVVTPAPGGAYVSDGQGGQSVFLRPGQSALGLSLEKVFADHATVMTDKGEVTLTLPDAASP